MRNIILTILAIAIGIPSVLAQNLTGAYIAKNGDDSHLILMVDGYISHSIFSNDTYKSTQGGTYKVENNNLVVVCEYDDKNAENIGNTHQFPLEIGTNSINIQGVPFQKQAVKAQGLDGLWRITGRKSNDGMQTIQRGDRKTIKILVDGFFQWIAINPAQKGFYGTGGGKYTFDKGLYQENISFFSRDNSRVGASLNFEGKIEDGQWHHSGKSSKGDPIHEIWSRDK